MNEKAVTELWNQSVAEISDSTYPKIIARFAELVEAEERKACAAVCARLRIATGERIGESDPATEAWNKALRDAERFIAERSNAPDQATDAAFCAGHLDCRVMPGGTTKKGNGNG
jgi:hypothetical protein